MTNQAHNKRRKPLARLEEIEQARVIAWSHRPAVRAAIPAVRWLHHSPNGGKRDAFTGAQLKALGVSPGFPDLILPARSANGMNPGLAIEMKRPDGKGRVSDSQGEWLDYLDSQGWHTAVATSAEQAARIIIEYLAGEEAAVAMIEAAQKEAA